MESRKRKDPRAIDELMRIEAGDAISDVELDLYLDRSSS